MKGGDPVKTYQEMIRDYQKRQRDTLVDTIASGLSRVDEIAIDTGILEETGLMTELTQTATSVLPFVIIAATEGTKVILGRKPGKTSLKDGAWRMAKTGVAMGIGGAVAAAAGIWAALPATMGVRALCDRYRLSSLTGARVRARTTRLKELRGLLDRRALPDRPERIPEPMDIIADITEEPAAG